MTSTIPVAIKSFKVGYDTYDQPEVMPDDAFPQLEDTLCYRGVLRKRDGYESLIDPAEFDITGITNAVNAQVTTLTAHGYAVGAQVIITGATGVTGINGIEFRITAVAAFTFNIDNTVAPGIYTGAGTVQKVKLLGSFAITTISNAAAAQITTAVAHKMSNNQQVFLTDIVGMLSAGGISLNDPINPYDITVIGATTFTIPVNTIGYTAYGRGGIVHQPVMGLKNRLTGNFFADLIAFNESQAFLFTDATGEFTNISTAGIVWTGNDSQFFWSTNYLSSFWVTNNVDPIRYYEGTVWTNFSPATTAAGNTMHHSLMLFPYKGRMVALNTTEVVGGGTINYPQRARWSQIGNPYVTAPNPGFPGPVADAWKEDIIGKGGYIDAPTSEKIVSAGFVRDTLVVMFEHSAWRLRYTENQLLPFVWERFNSQFGAEGTYSVVGFDEGVITIGSDGIIFADSNAAARIDMIIPDWVFEIEDSSFNGQRRLQGIRDFQRNLVYWTYTIDKKLTPGLDNGERYPTHVLCYNYIEKSFSIFNQSFTTFGQYRIARDLTWGAATMKWSENNNFWNSGNLQAGFPSIVSGNRLGNVWILTKDYTVDDETGFNFSILTKKFNPFAEKGQQAKAIYLHFLVSGTVAGEFTVEHYIDEDDTIPIETLIVSTNTNGQEKVWRRIALSGTSQYHQFLLKFSNAQLADQLISSADYDFYQMIFEFAPAGRLNYGDMTT